MTETTQAAALSTDPGPPPPAPEGMPTRRDRFFDWVRGFGMMRSDGWLGGVCAGIAARLRVDPLIVRGVFVVAALLGLPMLVIYAIAWALLPDEEERIPLQDLLRGRFEPVLIGIGVVFLLGLFPVVPWAFGSVLGAGLFVLNTAAAQALLALLIIAVVILGGYLVSRLARRATTPRDTAAQRVRASSADAGSPAGAPEYSGTGASAFSPPDAEAETVPDAAEPASPASDAAAGEIAAWRAQHAAWKKQDAAWRRQQQDAERAARDQARREREERAAAFAAEASARRTARRASKPRASGAYVAVALGAAAIAGALVMLTQVGSENDAFAPALGLLTAALVGAIGMIVAGALRRRNGFLAFCTALLLLLGLSSAAAASFQNLRIGDAFFSTAEHSLSEGTLIHPWGSLTIELADTRVASAPIVLEKNSGYTQIQLEPGVELTLDATLGYGTRVEWVKVSANGGVEVTSLAGRGTLPYRGTISGSADPITTRQTVRLTQDSGVIQIHTWEG